jgi:hypothetical protein
MDSGHSNGPSNPPEFKRGSNSKRLAYWPATCNLCKRIPFQFNGLNVYDVCEVSRAHDAHEPDALMLDKHRPHRSFVPMILPVLHCAEMRSAPSVLRLYQLPMDSSRNQMWLQHWASLASIGNPVTVP